MEHYKEGDTLTHKDGRTATLSGGEWVVSETPKDFSFGEMASNIPSSAVQFGKDIIQPIIHPVDAAQNIGKLIAGGASNIAKYAREQGFPLVPEPSKESLAKHGGFYPYEKEADAAGKAISDRYGSTQALKQTLMRDPVGLMGDAASILTGGGAMLGKFGGKMKTAGMAMEPLNLIKGTAKTLTGAALPSSLPVGLYKSAVKFPTTLDTKFGMGTRTALAETALKNKIMPTEAGVLKLAEYQKDLGVKIGSLVDEAADAGKTIPKSKIFKLLKEARKSVGGVRIGAQKNLKQIDDLAKELSAQMKKIDSASLTPRQLQDLKISAQKASKYEIGSVKETGREAGSEAVASAAKTELEGVIPEIKGLNRELGDLKSLEKPLMQAASRIENRDLISIGTPIKTIAGGEIGGNRGAMVGLIAGMAESKKAQLAISLKTIQDAGLGNLIDHKLIPTLVKQGLWQSGRLEPENK